MKNFYKLLISIVVCQLAGFLGSLFTSSSVSTWYVTLNKPWFNPPSWVFAPVWIMLYVLMGISLYLVWKKGFKGNSLLFFSLQLFLNFLWSILFFGLNSPLLAFIEIIILWLFIILTIMSFYKISRPAAYLLIPYLLWVTFAAMLNLAIVVVN